MKKTVQDCNCVLGCLENHEIDSRSYVVEIVWFGLNFDICGILSIGLMPRMSFFFFAPNNLRTLKADLGASA